MLAALLLGMVACGVQEGGTDLVGSNQEIPSFDVTVMDDDPTKYAYFGEMMRTLDTWDGSFPIRIIRKNTAGELVGNDVFWSAADLQALSKAREQNYAEYPDSRLLGLKRLLEGVPDTDPDKKELLGLVNREAQARGLIK